VALRILLGILVLGGLLVLFWAYVEDLVLVLGSLKDILDRFFHR